MLYGSQDDVTVITRGACCLHHPCQCRLDHGMVPLSVCHVHEAHRVPISVRWKRSGGMGGILVEEAQSVHLRLVVGVGGW